MPHPFDPQSWNERPAMRVFVLAWAAAAAQTPIAAWAWMSCLAFGLAASRWPLRSEAPPAEPTSTASPTAPTLALASHSTVAPTPRRSAARRAPATPRRQAPPLLTAHQDAVTGLLTCEHLHDTAEAWAQSLRAESQSVCVLQLALQGIDTVVERYGHEAGQQLRLQVARRLRHLARPDDKVVRLGDDSFALLVGCPADDAAALARSLGSRLVQEVQRPLAYRTLTNLHVGCGVGTSIWPLQAETLAEAMRQAASALELACRSGRGQVRQYSALREAVAA